MDLHGGSHVSYDSTNKIDFKSGPALEICTAARIKMQTAMTTVTESNVVDICAGKITM